MEKIDKYEIVGVIGEGGMGRVYEARDPIIGRRVAIKMISINRARDGEVHARFVREAQAAGQLSHPNLITIHDIGVAGTDPYIVMELLDGADLGQVIKDGRLTLPEKIRIMREICEGLAFAHKRGVIHRDIKPGNVFITSDGRVKILDFGLARSTVSDITQTGSVVGTPNYMAPEQIRGETIDHRADIFAAGVVFYELLSGRKAFEADTVATTIYKVLETQPPAIHVLDAALPGELSAIVERAIAKEPSARYQTAGELIDALAHVPIAAAAAEPLSPAAGLHRWSKRGMAAAAGVVLVLGVTVLAIALRPSRSDSNANVQQTSALSSGAADRSLTPDRADAPAAAPPAASAPIVPPAPSPRPQAAPGSGDAVARPLAAGAGRSGRQTPQVLPPPVVPAPPPPAGSVPVPPPVSTAPFTAPTAAEPRTPPANVPSAPPAADVEPPIPVASPREAAAASEAVATAAVQGILSRYQAALESRDIEALKRIWPTLAGRQEDAIRSEFQHARSIDVTLDGVNVKVAGANAVVTGRRDYRVTTVEGRTLRNATRMTMTLARHDGAWTIETIRYETTP